MGNAISTDTTAASKLSDGTKVGDTSEAGRAFAATVARMHSIFPSCDCEFRDLSDAVNTHGKKSSEFAAAAERLKACQKRRTQQFTEIESKCGPAQESYRLCVERIRKEGNAGSEHLCLPVMQTFLDCAERALDGKAKV